MLFLKSLIITDCCNTGWNITELVVQNVLKAQHFLRCDKIRQSDYFNQESANITWSYFLRLSLLWEICFINTPLQQSNKTNIRVKS